MKWVNHPNTKRWLNPPTIEQIEAAVKKAGVSEFQFERYHGIYRGCIKNIRLGLRHMPSPYWHLFLDEENTVTTIQPPAKSKPKIKRTKVIPKGKLADLI